MLYLNTLRSNYIQICIATAVALGITADAFCQIVYTSSFTKKIEKAGIDLYTPVEQWLHVYPLDRDSFMTYDLVLQNDINNFEVRYRIRPDNRRWRKVPDQIEFNRLIATIATNDPEAEIRVAVPDTSFARENFNATNCYFAFFRPKESFSEKPYGTLITLESDYGVSIDVILLHYDPEYDPLGSFRNLRFQ